MRRRTFDALATTAGLLLAAVLLVAGILLGWAHSFVTNEVHSQLASQKIEFPATTNPEFKALPKADAAAMGQYAGQLMTTGAQAETYADHFIAYHLTLIGGGKTYSQLSTESLAQPANVKLAGEVQTVFRGDTLRSMLLNAYGFGKMGDIAGIASVVAYIGAGLLLVLSGFGLVHLRRASPGAEIFPRIATRAEANAG
jgi:hypothetical protein